MLLLLAGCAHVPRPPVDPAPPAPPVDGLPAGASAAPATQLGGVVLLDEAGLAALLANPGEGPLVVNFWATWCGPCVHELDTMRSVAADSPGARFALVSVDDPGEVAHVAPFLTAHHVALPVYQLTARDPSAVLVRQVPHWPDLIPVTLVVDPGGDIRARFEGEVDPASLRAALE